MRTEFHMIMTPFMALSVTMKSCTITILPKFFWMSISFSFFYTHQLHQCAYLVLDDLPSDVLQLGFQPFLILYLDAPLLHVFQLGLKRLPEGFELELPHMVPVDHRLPVEIEEVLPQRGINQVLTLPLFKELPAVKLSHIKVCYFLLPPLEEPRVHRR